MYWKNRIKISISGCYKRPFSWYNLWMWVENRSQDSILFYRLCQKKLYNFQFLIAEKVNKAQQENSGGQNIIILCVRNFFFLNAIIPWSGVKVMVHWVMCVKTKWATFAIIMKVMVRVSLVKHTLIWGNLRLVLPSSHTYWLPLGLHA